jgi:hypothetical protein
MDAGPVVAQNDPRREMIAAMKPMEIRPEIAAPKLSRTVAPDQSLVLNAVVVHQDAPCREPAIELCSRVSRSIGPQSFYVRLWSFRDLSETEVLIVSVRAADKLHSRLCGWIDSWVPRRHRLEGTLIALVDVTGQHGAALEFVQTQLREVARKARLEFLLREYSVATADGSFKMAMVPAEPNAALSKP